MFKKIQKTGLLCLLLVGAVLVTLCGCKDSKSLQSADAESAIVDPALINRADVLELVYHTAPDTTLPQYRQVTDAAAIQALCENLQGRTGKKKTDPAIQGGEEIIVRFYEGDTLLCSVGAILHDHYVIYRASDPAELQWYLSEGVATLFEQLWENAQPKP